MIYHIAQKKDWETALRDNSYKAASIGKEGFIHCSPAEKVLQVANIFYKGHSDLVLLSIDESRVKSKIVWEDQYDHGFNFPHIYGELNLDAVVEVNDFEHDENNDFCFPG